MALQEPIDLLDSEWRDLARLLADHDIPPPQEVHVGLTRDGVVTEHCAVMVWERGEASIALVTREEAEELVDVLILLRADLDPELLVQRVRQHFGRER